MVDTMKTDSDPAQKPDGIIDSFLSRIFGRSWRTGLSGTFPFACAVVVAADQFIANPALHIASGICVAVGLGGAGAGLMKAKDAKVTGKP